MTLRCALALLLVFAAQQGVRAQEPEQRLVTMGTGSVAALYYPVGVALCRLVNQTRREHGLRCSAQPTAGSTVNIESLRDDTLQMAIVQSDVQAAALEGAADAQEVAPFSDLRAVMSLYAEPMTVVARAGTGIASVSELAGKRVGLGMQGSGERLLMDALMEELGWTDDTFAAAPELASTDVARALCTDRIDAYVRVVGHPALVIQETTGACGADLVPVTGPEVAALIAAHPSYFDTTIPGGLYAGNPEPVETFGVGATLVTRADLPENVVYTVVSAIFGNFNMLRGLNPVLTDLEERAMASKGLTAPLHPGAERYYREREWLE